jgi:hypothetical protein
VAAAEEAVVRILPAVQAEVHIPGVVRVAVPEVAHVLQVAEVHLHLVAGNF